MKTQKNSVVKTKTTYIDYTFDVEVDEEEYKEDDGTTKTKLYTSHKGNRNAYFTNLFVDDREKNTTGGGVSKGDTIKRTVKAGIGAKIATLYSKIASVAQTAATKYTTAYLKEIKFGIAQDRKVFIKAVGWRESQNESYEDNNVLFTAIDEMVDYELSELI